MSTDDTASGSQVERRPARVPVPQWMRTYDRADLRGDLLAALVITALMVPQSLGYAALAGAPVQAGLYAIPLALIAYALLGSSPQLVVGPVSTVSVLTGSIVAARRLFDPSEALAVVTTLAIISGVILLVAGLLRIGWVAEFLSKPIITGFVFGLSIVIVIGESATLLGLPRVTGSAFNQIRGIVDTIGEVDATTAAIGGGTLVVLFLGPKLSRVVPWGLLMVVAGLIGSRLADLAAEGVAVVGDVPSGLPAPSVPDIAASEVALLVVSGAALAMVGLAETLSAARLFAVRNGYQINADQEFVATGVANIAAGFSGGVGVGGSLSKTAASDNAGGRSQVTGLAATVLVVLVLLLFASSLSDLPRAVLSAVVIHAVWGLMDVKAIRRYRRIRRNDFVGALAALIGVLVFGTLYGLLFAVAQSVLGLIYRSVQVEVDVMGKVQGEKAAWGSLGRNPDHRTQDGILILRLSAPLFWVNAAKASQLIMREVLATTEKPRAVIIDLEATNQLDTTSADVLMQLIQRLRRREIDVYLVRVMYPARRVLRRTGVTDLIGTSHMWRTISQGVKAAKRSAKDDAEDDA